ncbi:hypothetical protein RUM44_002127 [Polyplax serrata]|uniref:Uncharacterized protein n=1 Tax=Polyplax serrata TaxID=468196 RepID=A0ABR1AM05_POLSC
MRGRRGSNAETRKFSFPYAISNITNSRNKQKRQKESADSGDSGGEYLNLTTTTNFDPSWCWSETSKRKFFCQSAAKGKADGNRSAEKQKQLTLNKKKKKTDRKGAAECDEKLSVLSCLCVKDKEKSGGSHRGTLFEVDSGKVPRPQGAIRTASL